MEPIDPVDLPPVLVVEDECLVQMTIVDFLEDAGFTVIEAATGKEGLREFDRSPGIRALLTDIEMPGPVDGMRLARITHERYPEAAVGVVSGRVHPGKEELPPHARFFGKPYRHEEVVDTLHALMSKL